MEGGMEGGPAGGGSGSMEEEFEDSLDDFDEAMAGGESGGGGDEEEIDILSPTGEGSRGSPSDEPLFEEGDTGDDGSAGENESVAQRAASGGQSGQESSESGKASAGAGASGGGAGAEQGEREVAGGSDGNAEEGSEEIIPIPEDVGDGRNDDIVLRQIREAAMNERDPVLREKLWDEYRRIKGSR